MVFNSTKSKDLILLLVMKKCMNNMQCLQPRLARKFAKKRSKYKFYDLYNQQDMDEEEENEIDSLGKHYQIKLSCLCTMLQKISKCEVKA